MDVSKRLCSPRLKNRGGGFSYFGFSLIFFLYYIYILCTRSFIFYSASSFISAGLSEAAMMLIGSPRTLIESERKTTLRYRDVLLCSPVTCHGNGWLNLYAMIILIGGITPITMQAYIWIGFVYSCSSVYGECEID